jgi:hypothetical protein
VLRIHFEPVAAWMLGRVLVEQGDEARGLDSLTQAVRSATDRQSPLRPTAVAGIIQTLAGAYRAQDDPGSAVDTLRAGLRWFDSQRHVAGRGGADLDAALRAYLPDYADALDADDRPEDAAKVRDRLATLE